MKYCYECSCFCSKNDCQSNHSSKNHNKEIIDLKDFDNIYPKHLKGYCELYCKKIYICEKGSNFHIKHGIKLIEKLKR